MKESAQRIAIGKIADPNPPVEWNAVSPDGTVTCFHGTKQQVEDWLRDLPEDSWAKKYTAKPWKRYLNYTRCLNAMHEAVMSLTENQRDLFNAKLCEITEGCFDCSELYDLDAAINATAGQRAEAFLKTLRKWVEE